jgi:hypothetical protein
MIVHVLRQAFDGGGCVVVIVTMFFMMFDQQWWNNSTNVHRDAKRWLIVVYCNNLIARRVLIPNVRQCTMHVRRWLVYYYYLYYIVIVIVIVGGGIIICIFYM